MRPPERFSRAFCPIHGDVTGQTHYGRRPVGIGEDSAPEQEWCRCGWAVERATYVRVPASTSEGGSHG